MSHASPTSEISPELKQVGMWAMVSLTLGLAPFYPEPHIIGKIRWVAGGANGMSMMDWGDLLMHSAPWLILGYSLVQYVASRRRHTPS